MAGRTLQMAARGLGGRAVTNGDFVCISPATLTPLAPTSRKKTAKERRRNIVVGIEHPRQIDVTRERSDGQ